jgi:quercetin dioxygenase-like cupin family protein
MQAIPSSAKHCSTSLPERLRFSPLTAGSEHTSPYDAVVLVADGRAVLTIGGQEKQAESGQNIIMPAGVPHSVEAAEKFKMLLIMIRNK